MKRQRARAGRDSAMSVVRGFTLIEMMIAITLGLMILAALTTFFVQTSANRAEMARGSAQIENGRAALDILREDLSLAGFYSDVQQGPLQTPDACQTDPGSLGFKTESEKPVEMPVPIFGYPGLTGVPACISDAVPKTDVLVVRRFNTEPVRVSSAVSTHYYMQISHCATDSEKTLAFVGLGSAAGSLGLRKVNCAEPADLWRYHEHVYYVRRFSLKDGDNIPTLVRWENRWEGAYKEPIALAEGIQDMRIDYGVDMNNDGAPDEDGWCRFDEGGLNPKCSPANWANVMAVKVNLLSSTLEFSPDYQDKKKYSMGLAGTVGPFLNNDKTDPFGTWRKRHVYTAVVNAANRSGPRER